MKITKMKQGSLKDFKNAVESRISELSDNAIESSTVATNQKVKSILDKVYTVVKAYMTGPQGGFSSQEADDYFVVDYELVDNLLHIEVRAEISYEGLFDIIEILDPVVQSVDPQSYFDAVTSGIISADVKLK